MPVDVAAHDTGREISTPAVMPALVQSALQGFSRPLGVARRVTLEQKAGLRWAGFGAVFRSVRMDDAPYFIVSLNAWAEDRPPYS